MTETVANATRGEVSIALEGVDYVLRPSWEAIDAFERQTGTGIMELAADAGGGRMKSGTAAIVVTECIKAWGRATSNGAAAGVNARRVGELMMEAHGGLALALKKLELLLFMAATGGYTASGEVKPVTGSQSETPAAG